ncbi:MAG: glycosyltransferase family 2 protein [Planctomycetota bacterium]
MTETQISISAVIPAYNCEDYIARAINSVLNQTRPVNEVIVVDDGSKDKTVEAVRAFGDKVRLIQQPNGGASAARNAGIEAATGDWIAFLDGDDEWLLDKLERQCDILVRHADLAWISGNFKVCYCRQGHSLIKDDPQQVQSLLGGKLYFADYLDVFLEKVRGWTACMLIRKTVLEEAGLFCTDLPRINDIDMWFRIAYRYPQIGFAAEPLAIYHMEAGECLSGRPIMFDYLERFMQRHLNLSKDVGRQDALRPCVLQMLKDWIRSSFFDDRIYDISKAVRSFQSMLPGKYRRIVRLMTIWPGLTKCLLRSLSWVSRTCKIRRQTWHPQTRYRRRQKNRV